MAWFILVSAMIGWLTIGCLLSLFLVFVVIKIKPIFREKVYNDISRYNDFMNIVVLVLYLPITLILLLVDWFINDYSEWNRQKRILLKESLNSLKAK